MLEFLQDIIELLKSVNASHMGYKDIVVGYDKNDESSTYDIWILTQKCDYVSLEYQYAIENMNELSWLDCCKNAITDMQRLGYTLGSNPCTIVTWNIEFRAMELFNHPNQHITRGKNLEPIFFNIFPEAKDKITQYCLKNMADLTVDAVQCYISTTMIPSLQDNGMKTTTNTYGNHMLTSLVTKYPYKSTTL